MQSKNALVNHYKSLSIMNGDDGTNILNASGKIALGADEDRQKLKQDFDDISSIYTMANERNNRLENTLKRVRDRDIALS